MKSLPLELRQAKNMFGDDSPWLALFQLKMDDSLTFYLAANNEDVTFQGQVYTRFPLQVELPKSTNTGEIGTVSLTVANATRTLQPHLEQFSGGVGKPVTMIIVHADNLASDYAELTWEFTITGVKSTAEWITFTLGGPNPMRRRFPPEKYLAGYCRYAHFKGSECGYAGPATSCGRSLDNCRTLSNSHRFGGFPGLQPGGLRVV